MSPFEPAGRKLGIEAVVAQLPQTKGRVERNHAVSQDQLAKRAALAGISSSEKANEFLQAEYL